MGLFCEFDVCSDFGFIESTEEFGIVPDYSEGCSVFCETFLEVSQGIVPIDTGYLQSTLEADCSDTECWAETDCEYAQYVEYGTWKQAAQPYFEPALEQALAAAEPYWMDAQEAALDEEQQLMEEMEEEEQQMAMLGATQQSSWGSDIAQMGGSILGAIIAAFIITFFQALFNRDFREGSSRRSGSSGGGSVFVPDIIVT